MEPIGRGLKPLPMQVATKSSIWRGLHTLTPLCRGQRSEAFIKASCLLLSAFPGDARVVTSSFRGLLRGLWSWVGLQF